MPSVSPTILLVDEQPVGIDTLLAYLEDTAYTLITAADGQAAWEMLEADPDCYDAVILDHRVSGPGGPPVFEKMQAHRRLQEVPAILLIESAGQLRQAEVASNATPSYLEKPFDRAQLLCVLTMALRNRVCYRSSQGGRDHIGDTLGLQHEATFTFQSIHSARDLAALLANTCPEPQRVVVGLAELLLNAVEHGNLGISFDEKSRLRRENRWDEEVAIRLADPANAAKEVWVEYVREPDRIRILIRDQGDGFDWRRHLAMDPAQSTGLHGRGIAIARMMSFDHIEYRGRGNEVEVVVDTSGS
jgi:CheY-like chemotaxis protein